jgi:hypothetical protein
MFVLLQTRILQWRPLECCGGAPEWVTIARDLALLHCRAARAGPFNVNAFFPSFSLIWAWRARGYELAVEL